MVTPSARAALVAGLPALLRVKRSVVGSYGAVATLDAVHRLTQPRVSEVADQLALDLSTVSRQSRPRPKPPIQLPYVESAFHLQRNA